MWCKAMIVLYRVRQSRSLYCGFIFLFSVFILIKRDMINMCGKFVLCRLLTMSLLQLWTKQVVLYRTIVTEKC